MATIIAQRIMKAPATAPGRVTPASVQDLV